MCRLKHELKLWMKCKLENTYKENLFPGLYQLSPKETRLGPETRHWPQIGKVGKTDSKGYR